MAGAQLGHLAHTRRAAAGDGRLDRVGAMAGDHPGVVLIEGGGGGQHMGQQRAPRQPVQHLGQLNRKLTGKLTGKQI